MKRSFLLAGLGLASLSVGALAQNDAPGPMGADVPPGHAHAPLTRAEAEASVRAHFAALDKNKDGFLTPDELRRPMPSEADRQKMRDHLFAMMDKDGNGQISKSEFDAFHADRIGHGGGMHTDHIAGAPGDGAPPPGPMHPRFMHGWHGAMAGMIVRRADTDHDGKISLAEAEKAALDRFDRIDTNHDGVIDDAERQAAHQQMAARFRERRAHWMEHKGDMPPPPPMPTPKN